MSQQLFLLPPDNRVDYRRPQEPIARFAVVDGQCRRSLHRRWGKGPTIGWAMHNPSMADGMKDDPTLWRIMGFSFRWGYGGLTVVNMYPIITPSPRACRRWRRSIDAGDADAREAWIRNHYDCAEALAECGFVMAAWGNGADPDDVSLWLEHVERELGREIAWNCLGTNADGSPKHPLARGAHRVPDDQRPMRWR